METMISVKKFFYPIGFSHFSPNLVRFYDIRLSSIHTQYLGMFTFDNFNLKFANRKWKIWNIFRFRKRWNHRYCLFDELEYLFDFVNNNRERANKREIMDCERRSDQFVLFYKLMFHLLHNLLSWCEKMNGSMHGIWKKNGFKRDLSYTTLVYEALV